MAFTNTKQIIQQSLDKGKDNSIFGQKFRHSGRSESLAEIIMKREIILSVCSMAIPFVEF